ncbi:hypothetical protein BJK06_11225 [Curtobacterium sp. BH-2-1-1]|uniref:hypothetical protein n=1 Tax=Curtobacterium sp. BH-2-1-1 TaxID=1905847 RepID=UPI00089DDC72|nr:hypothetical protein [Curtobacterium sp. BH-2-1-1]AOX66251.1 hypothetical protein BJK06_11225 [Curtobacterium sp. BH-2-1-1]
MVLTRTNGAVITVLNDTFRPIDDQTWRAGPQEVIDEYSDSYLQAGDTAEKMSVEFRRLEDDGEYRFFVVGRDHDLTEPVTETIDVQAAHEPRHPAELFTADHAAPVFVHYVEHQTVPEGYTLRVSADM